MTTPTMLFQGRTLEQLVGEISRQKDAKQDFVTDTRKMSVDIDTAEAGRTLSLNTDLGSYPVNNHAAKQIASRLDIPTKHFERMQHNYPDVLETTVNRIFQEEPQNRMVRTLDNTARAFLSDRYKRIDNYGVLGTALEAIADQSEMQIASSEVTENKMYLKAVFPKLEGAVRVGDPVQSGVIIKNSEVGSGGVVVQPFIYRLWCTNGMSSMDKGRKYSRSHLGSQVDSGVMYQADTLAADTEAVMLSMRDHIRTVASPEAFAKLLAEMQATTERTVSGANIPAAVEALAETLKLTDSEQNNVLGSFLENKDFTQWGMLNAVTDASKLADNYTRATEMEELGGQVLDLNPAQWQRIAEAA